MKRVSSSSLRLGTVLHPLGGALIIVGVFFLPMVIVGGWNGQEYIYRPHSEWVTVNENLNTPLLALLLNAVLVAFPLLSLFSVLSTSIAGLFLEGSSRMIGVWRRIAAIAAIVGLIAHCLLGALWLTLGSINARVELGAGFGLVLLGFMVMIVSTFLN